MKTRNSIFFLIVQLPIFILGFIIFGPPDIYGFFIKTYLIGFPLLAVLVAAIFSFKRKNMSYLLGTILMWPLIYLIGYNVLRFQQHQEYLDDMQNLSKSEKKQIEPVLKAVKEYEYVGFDTLRYCSIIKNKAGDSLYISVDGDSTIHLFKFNLKLLPEKDTFQIAEVAIQLASPFADSSVLNTIKEAIIMRNVCFFTHSDESEELIIPCTTNQSPTNPIHFTIIRDQMGVPAIMVDISSEASKL